MLGQLLQTALKSAGIATADAASHIGVSEANLYKLFKKDSFEVAYLRKAAELLKLPIGYFLDEDTTANNSQISDFSRASNNASQKMKANKALAPDLAFELAACQRELEIMRALVAAKEETIGLLRANYNRPT